MHVYVAFTTDVHFGMETCEISEVKTLVSEISENCHNAVCQTEIIVFWALTSFV